MMKEGSTKRTYDAVQDWVVQAYSSSAFDPPDTTRLCEVLPDGAHRSILEAHPTKYKGRIVVEFLVTGDRRVGTKARHVLPVHFAILRTLELVPGLKIWMKDDPHRKREIDAGVVKAEDDRLFHLCVRCKPREYKKPLVTNVARILFNVSEDAELRERRTGDYHYIVPEGYIPLPDAEQGHTGRDALLDAVRKLMLAAKPGSLAYSAEQIEMVLTSLFSISDDWHWNELLDRLPGDRRDKH